MNALNWLLLTLPLFGLAGVLIGLRVHDKCRPLTRQPSPTQQGEP